MTNVVVLITCIFGSRLLFYLDRNRDRAKQYKLDLVKQRIVLINLGPIGVFGFEQMDQELSNVIRMFAN